MNVLTKVLILLSLAVLLFTTVVHHANAGENPNFHEDYIIPMEKIQSFKSEAEKIPLPDLIHQMYVGVAISGACWDKYGDAFFQEAADDTLELLIALDKFDFDLIYQYLDLFIKSGVLDPKSCYNDTQILDVVTGIVQKKLGVL